MNLAEYRAELSFVMGFNDGLRKAASLMQTLPVLARSTHSGVRGLAQAASKRVKKGDVKGLKSALSRSETASDPVSRAAAKLMSVSAAPGGLKGALKSRTALAS